jgi:hypothetical protein
MSVPTRNILTSTVGGVVVTLDASGANLTPRQLGTLQSKMTDILGIVGGVTLSHPVRNGDLEHAQHYQHGNTTEPHP